MSSLRDDSDIEKVSDLNQPTSDVEIYAQEVLSGLFEDNIPPTPSNFQIYFDRNLDKKSIALRKEVASITEFEDSNDAEQQIQFEKSLKQGFRSVKQVLNVTNSFYKNIAVMSKILAKRQQELDKQSSIKAAKGTISKLEADLGKLEGIVHKQIESVKDLYSETGDILKDVENNTMFDNQFGVYNKRFLLSKIEQEQNAIEKFNHKSTVLMLSLAKSIRSAAPNEKSTHLMTRTVSRLLLKTSRRTDIVAHYGDGVFCMMLSHTDLTHAQKASERLLDLVSNSNFFLNNEEVQLDIDLGIADITTKRTIEETIVCAIEAMKEASNSPNEGFKLCQIDEGEHS